MSIHIESKLSTAIHVLHFRSMVAVHMGRVSSKFYSIIWSFLVRSVAEEQKHSIFIFMFIVCGTRVRMALLIGYMTRPHAGLPGV
jgi:hypothetical protein